MAVVGAVNIGSSSDVIRALNDIVQTNITSIVITFILAAVILLLLKTIAEAAAGFIQLRLDQHLAIGSFVEIYKKQGFIKQVSLFTITIETDHEYIRVPTKQWRFTKMLILKDSHPIRDRRKEDKNVEKIKDLVKETIKEGTELCNCPVINK